MTTMPAMAGSSSTTAISTKKACCGPAGPATSSPACRFGPDKTLWAFDCNAHAVLRYGPDGKELPRIKFVDRSFSNINFTADGNVLFGEHLVGNTIKLPPERPLGTTLAKMPGSDRFGDGHVFKFTPDGKLLKEYATETHGGMAGFLGATTASLAPDNRTLVYCSETGTRVFQYDIVADKQLPDLITLQPGAGEMALLAQHLPDGTLLYMKANFKTGFKLDHLKANGELIKSWDLPGPGWATVIPLAGARRTAARQLLYRHGGQVRHAERRHHRQSGNRRQALTGRPRAVSRLNAETVGAASAAIFFRRRSRLKPLLRPLLPGQDAAVEGPEGSGVFQAGVDR